MKKLLLTIAFLIGFSLSLYSQNIEPDALYFSIPRTSGTVTKQFSILDSEYKQNNFLLTWQWGNHPRLSEALKMISSHGSAPSWGPKDLIENTTGTELKYIYQLRRWDYSFAMPQEYSNSFTFKPTFTVEPDNFTPNPNDPEHNIWGFRNRGITNPVVTNNKLELTTTTSYTNPVLSNPWRCNNFYSLPKDHKLKLDTLINGKYWRVTLNLRRKNFAPLNNISDNNPVLVIKMPYYLTAGSSGSNGNITFNTKPDYTTRTQMNYTYSDGTNNHTVNRGYQLGMTSITSVDSIVITRNMLPNMADTIAGIGPDITITFSFAADLPINPLFKTSAKDKTHEMIDSIGLDVYYRGNCDILLNYIRVGNPLSDKLWKGEIDTAYHNVIQQHINIIKDKNYRLFRFYGRDEIDEHYELWDAMRYFNKIVGGLAITEGNSPDSRYLWRTEADKQWRGSIALGKTAVPHFSINDNKLDYIDKADPIFGFKYINPSISIKPNDRELKLFIYSLK